MRRREEEIGRFVRFLREKSKGFVAPSMVVIGGYALRAYVPFSRYSRDCDFALQSGLDIIREWRPEGVTEQAFEEHGTYGFLRWISPIGDGKRAVRVGIDFMAGQITGREGQAFTVGERFLDGAKETVLSIGGEKVRVFVPSYADLFVMKVVSARKSDVRDVAAMVWKNGAPDIGESLRSLNDPKHFFDSLENRVLPEIGHKHFIDSWRGMFVTEEFGENERAEVSKRLGGLITT